MYHAAWRDTSISFAHVGKDMYCTPLISTVKFSIPLNIANKNNFVKIILDIINYFVYIINMSKNYNPFQDESRQGLSKWSGKGWT